MVQLEAEHAGMECTLIGADDNANITELASQWVLVSTDHDFLARQELDDNRMEITPIRGLRLWTDDYSSLQPLLRPLSDPWWKWRDD